MSPLSQGRVGQGPQALPHDRPRAIAQVEITEFRKITRRRPDKGAAEESAGGIEFKLGVHSDRPEENLLQQRTFKVQALIGRKFGHLDILEQALNSLSDQVKPRRRIIPHRLVGVGWQVWLKDQVAYARIATAYGAKQVCSCLHVAERPMDSCLNDFPTDFSAVTRASVLGGLVDARAHFEPGLGGTLVKP